MTEKKKIDKKNEYEIIPISTEKNKIPQKKSSKIKEMIMPKYPFSLIISGSSGSGKTQLLLNILTRENLYGEYFHKLIVFSPTAGELDDTYDVLKIPKENYIKIFNKEILDRILENRKKQIKEKGIEYVAKKDRVIIIFDDMISEKIMQSPEIITMFTLLRHYLISVCILSQSLTKINRTVRINANMLCIFPSLSSEIEIMTDEIMPANLNKKEFREIIQYCTSKKYEFMTINNNAQNGQKIRKNLDEIINLDKFKFKFK